MEGKSPVSKVSGMNVSVSGLQQSREVARNNRREYVHAAPPMNCNGWTHDAIQCYELSANCGQCPITRMKFDFVCKMSQSVKQLLEKLGPPKQDLETGQRLTTKEWYLKLRTGLGQPE